MSCQTFNETCMPDSPPRYHTSQTRRYPTSRWQQLKQSLAAHDDQGAVDTLLDDLHESEQHDKHGSWQFTGWKLHMDQEPSGVAGNQLHDCLSGSEEASDLLRHAVNLEHSADREVVADRSYQIQYDGSIVSSSWHDLHSSVLQGYYVNVSLPLTAPTTQTTATSSPAPLPSQRKSVCRQSSLDLLKQRRQQVQHHSVDPSSNTSSSGVLSPMKQQTDASRRRPSSSPYTRSSMTTASTTTLDTAATYRQPTFQQSCGSHMGHQQDSGDSGSSSSLVRQTGRYAASCAQISTKRPWSAAAKWYDASKTGSAPMMSLSSINNSKKPVIPSTHSNDVLDSIEGLDSSLLCNLRQDLSQQLLHKVIRRWQQATADVLLEKAHARPIRNLLSKRKALRAWCTAKQQRVGHDDSHLVQLSGQSAAASKQQALQPIPVTLEARTDQQQAQQQLPEHLLRHYQVAAQFHRLYMLHSCFGSWRHQAVTGALQRVRAEQDRLLQEQQARVLLQQQELQQKQHQQQRRQQEERKAAVAANFHRLYVLYRSTTVWHQQAAMSASLNKLFPDPDRAAAARGGNCKQTVRHSVIFPHKAGSDELQAAAVVQYKAQQLLQKLAAKQAARTQQQQQQQQQQQPTQPAEADAQHTKLKLHRELQQQQHQVVSWKTGDRKEQVDHARSADCADKGHSALHADDKQNGAGPCAAVSQVPVVADNCGSQQVDAQSGQEDTGLRSEPPMVSTSKPSAAASGSEYVIAAAAVTGGKQETDLEPLTLEGERFLQRTLTVDQPQRYDMLADQVLDPPELPRLPPDDAAVDQVQQTEQPQQDCAAEDACAPHSTSGAPEQDLQQQQQQWVQDRQQLQQQLKRLIALEQSWQREEQKLEQQLHTEIAEEQGLLAELHYNLVLAQRLGLAPWKKLMQLQKHQEVLAGEWRRAGLLRAGMFVWKLLLVHRRKRRLCCHVRALGKLRHMQQQQQQSLALHAWSNWTLASNQHSCCLLHKTVTAWRSECRLSCEQQAVACNMGDRKMKQQTLAAWQQFVEQQGQEQLLLEVELNKTAEAWRRRWWQQRVLVSWRAAVVTAVQGRQIDARRQEAWGKVRGWLAEFDSTKQKAYLAMEPAVQASTGSFDKCSESEDSQSSALLQLGAAVNAGADNWGWSADVDDACISDQ